MLLGKWYGIYSEICKKQLHTLWGRREEVLKIKLYI